MTTLCVVIWKTARLVKLLSRNQAFDSDNFRCVVGAMQLNFSRSHRGLLEGLKARRLGFMIIQSLFRVAQTACRSYNQSETPALPFKLNSSEAERPVPLLPDLITISCEIHPASQSHTEQAGHILGDPSSIYDWGRRPKRGGFLGLCVVKKHETN